MALEIAVLEGLPECAGIFIIVRKPGDSCPLPFPSWTRISWYSFGDIVSNKVELLDHEPERQVHSAEERDERLVFSCWRKSSMSRSV